MFQPIIDGKPSREVEFTKVLHVPALHNNLLSVLYLTRHKEFHVHITSKTMKFIRHGDLLFTASITDQNIGHLDGKTIVNKTENVHISSTLPLDLSLWHRRLGHHHYEGIKNLIRKNMVKGLVLSSKAEPDPLCEPCLAGKMHANPFLSSEHHCNEPLELVHTEVHDVGTRS